MLFRSIMRLRTDPDVGFIVQQLDELESYLNPSKLSYLRRSWRYVNHKWRRRGVVSVKNVLATLLEGFGRTASEFCETENNEVSDEIRKSIGDFLQLGSTRLFGGAFPGIRRAGGSPLSAARARRAQDVVG